MKNQGSKEEKKKVEAPASRTMLEAEEQALAQQKFWLKEFPDFVH